METRHHVNNISAGRILPLWAALALSLAAAPGRAETCPATGDGTPAAADNTTAAVKAPGGDGTPSATKALSAGPDTLGGVVVERAAMRHNEELMSVGLDLTLRSLELRGDRAALYTPVLRSGLDSVELSPVGIYGRTRWFQHLRAGEPLGGEAERSLRRSERPDTLAYRADVPWRPWMDGAGLYLRRRDYGCCNLLLDEREIPLGRWREVRFRPDFRYVRPAAAGVKHRELSGRAYIDFPVNRTEMYPDYRQNPRELAKIVATIDSVRNDPDVTVQAITIKGYASPEGPWDNNVRLAKGRTATLKQYVENMYRFEPGFIRTDYEPEDWAGLRAWVEGSGLEHRAEILALIDGDLEPDAKNWKLQSSWPEEYKFLLATVYPGLRHSDYTIAYTIRAYTEPEEIGRLLRTAPQKLSLEEMYRYAQTLEVGGEAWDEVFETAVRMYPEDGTANLNAANAAMGRSDLKGAEKYLAKAGDGAEAEYARGVLAALQGDYVAARAQVRKAAALGMPDTEGVLAQLDEVERFENGNETTR